MGDNLCSGWVEVVKLPHKLGLQHISLKLSSVGDKAEKEKQKTAGEMTI